MADLIIERRENFSKLQARPGSDPDGHHLCARLLFHKKPPQAGTVDTFHHAHHGPCASSIFHAQLRLLAIATDGHSSVSRIIILTAIS
jgi:hypothetical protein